MIHDSAREDSDQVMLGPIWFGGTSPQIPEGIGGLDIETKPYFQDFKTPKIHPRPLSLKIIDIYIYIIMSRASIHIEIYKYMSEM